MSRAFRVAGVHRLQEVIATFVADFAHDDAVGTMPQSGGDKLAWRYSNLTGISATASNELHWDARPSTRLVAQSRSAVPVAEHDRAGPSSAWFFPSRFHCDDAVLSIRDELHNHIPDMSWQTACRDQFIGGEQRLNLRTVKVGR